MAQSFSITTLRNLLEARRLNEAMELLKGTLLNSVNIVANASRILSELDSLAVTYRYMTEFMISGKADDGREREYGRIVEKLEEIGKEVDFALSINNPGAYYEARRIDAIHPESVQNVLEAYRNTAKKLRFANEANMDIPNLKKKKEELLSNIFRKVWIMGPDRREENEAILAIADEDFDFEMMCEVVAGLMLGMLQYYDRRKLLTLITLYNKLSVRPGTEKLQARILLSIVIILDYWKIEIEKDAELGRTIHQLFNDEKEGKRLKDVVLMLIKTKDTDRVSKKIKEDLMPALMNSSPEIMRKLREGSGAVDLSEFEENPEWEKFLKESGLQNKLMELNEMQMAGMDVIMQAFAQLKTFPFFRNPANWFLPFLDDHSALAHFKAYNNEALTNILGESLGFCDSDKYSFVLSLCSMPAERAMALSSQLEAGFEQMKEELKSNSLFKKQSEFSMELISYARDLYRFFRLYPKRREYPKIFAEMIDFRNLPFVGSKLTTPETLEETANFFFGTGYYKEALSLYENMALLSSSDRPLFEKIGYCHQVRGDYERALENYEKADLFSSDADPASLWLIKKIALCNKVLGNTKEATEYYRRAMEKDPADAKLKLNFGHLLLKQGNAQGALKTYYSVHYEQPDNKQAIRSVARGEMKNGNLENALTYIDKLLKNDPSTYDIKLAAHQAYLSGNYEDAVRQYVCSLDEETPMEEQRKEMEEEMRFLQDGDFDPIAFSLVMDEVQKRRSKTS